MADARHRVQLEGEFDDAPDGWVMPAGAWRDDLLDTEAVEFALAVSEALGFDSHAVEHGHE